jgi:hypothetical protein
MNDIKNKVKELNEKVVMLQEALEWHLDPDWAGVEPSADTVKREMQVVLGLSEELTKCGFDIVDCDSCHRVDPDDIDLSDYAPEPPECGF